jgi:hypothetical protein
MEWFEMSYHLTDAATVRSNNLWKISSRPKISDSKMR